MEDYDLRNECSRIITEIQPHVSSAEVSKTLEYTYSVAHMNLVTKEDIKMCVRLTARGFEIVGDEFDTANKEPTITYELIDQLLSDLSPKYRESFSSLLAQKLQNLQ